MSSKKRKLQEEELEEELPAAAETKTKKKKKKARKPSIKTKLVQQLRSKRKELHSALCQVNRDLTSLGAGHKKKLKCK